ncbi:DUF3493 domain-containing protein [Oscillatoria salina IIICB1]|nr:DUF3493 domain-containing protein [Oscillatoria salina]MBZ8181331.1 DUF3493 domain-containing protein [Oscillatoria salina IIICB1]NET87815.1 DUF3493 domain-containing protein [Kamptonema sp. SIO1D9]
MAEKRKPPGSKLDPEKYARLKAEAKAPYRGLRKFIYFTFGASGLIGAVVFLAQLAAGRDVATALPNFALQVGVVALMIFLFRWENEVERKG